MKDAGFEVSEKRLLELGLRGGDVRGFDPHFNKTLREAAYEHAEQEIADEPSTLRRINFRAEST